MLKPLLGLIAVVVLGGAIVLTDGPALWRDIRLSDAALVPAFDHKLEEASCSSHWWIISNCTIRYRAPQATEKQSISFSVFGTLGGERVRLLRTADGRAVTTDIGRAKLANRIAATIFFLGTFAAMGFFAFRRAAAAM